MTQTSPIRVAIVDNWSVVRAGLGVFIRSAGDLNLVGEAATGEEALELCRLVAPHVFLVALDLADIDSIALIVILRQQNPASRILALANRHDHETIEKALGAGAQGFLLKSAAPDEVAAMIRGIVSDGHHSAPAVSPPDPGKIAVERLKLDLEAIVLDATRLSDLLHQHMPKIFPRCQSEVVMFPLRTLYAYPAEHLKQVPGQAWTWLRSRPEPCIYSSREETPWGEKIEADHKLILVPIASSSGREVLGAIGLLGNDKNISHSNPLALLQSLAVHISSAIEKALMQTVRSGRSNLAEQLAMAGRIQAEILPARAPQVRGWDIAARLVPALETSGDFYDFIRLSNNNLGIVIADVSDKGMGAALFMALSNTLIRTYASQYSTLPSFALGMANERILLDTRSGMFVTAFYGVLEPDTGRMRYVNAGHNPPYLYSTQKKKTVDWLRSTGMALGVMEDAAWSQKIIKFFPGDVLLLYTDGVTDAQDKNGRYYGEKRLQEVVRSMRDCSANALLDTLLEDLQRFTGGMPQQDDITLVVVCRQANP